LPFGTDNKATVPRSPPLPFSVFPFFSFFYSLLIDPRPTNDDVNILSPLFCGRSLFSLFWRILWWRGCGIGTLVHQRFGTDKFCLPLLCDFVFPLLGHRIYTQFGEPQPLVAFVFPCCAFPPSGTQSWRPQCLFGPFPLFGIPDLCDRQQHRVNGATPSDPSR